MNKDLVYSKEKKYYFNKGDGDFVIANKKNLLKVFFQNKTLIENFLKEHNIDYNNEEDLKKLFEYLGIL